MEPTSTTKELLSLLQGEPEFIMQQPDKTIKGYRLYDLRYASELDLMFTTIHLGKNKFGNAFDPANLEQIQILLTEGFGYQGIIDQKGKIHLSLPLYNEKITNGIPILDKTLWDSKTKDKNKKIVDFGEKIGGAKKDKYASLRENITRFTPEELLNSPKSKTLLSVNYGEMIKDSVASIQEVTLLKYFKDNIGKKPSRNSSFYTRKKWLQQVSHYQQLLNRLLNQEDTFTESTADFIKKHIPIDWTRFEQYSRIITRLGFPDKDINLNNHDIIKDYGREEYMIVKGNYIVKRNFPTFEKALDTLAEIFEKKNTSKSTFQLFYNKQTQKYLIGKKVKTKIVTLIENFNTLEEARNYLKSNQEELETLYQKQKIIVQERPVDNKDRVGKDYLLGKDVTPEMFNQVFGFRGVEFGNWVNDQERQTALNQAYIALMDLSLATNISPKAISLNGELGLAFGSRGFGKASAHYEPARIVINITKTKGAGSLAHEWWHALDNYFSRLDGLSLSFLTNRNQTRQASGGVREEMYKAYSQIVSTLRNSDIKKRSKKLDYLCNKCYWATNEELTARSFECWIAEKLHTKGIQNDYLVNFKKITNWSTNSRLSIDTYPYPLENEISTINQVFDSFFNTIKEKEGENEKRVLFRQVEEDKIESSCLSKDDLQTIQTMSDALHVDIISLQNRSEINHMLNKQIEKNRFPGLYDPTSDKIYLILDEIRDQADLQATILHEVIGHKGLRILFKEEFVPQLKKIWNEIPNIEKIGLLKQNKYDWIRTTEEYMAQLAEHYQEPSRFQKIKAVFKEFFRKVLKIELKITDNDLKFILYKAKRSLQKKNENNSEKLHFDDSPKNKRRIKR